MARPQTRPKCPIFDYFEPKTVQNESKMIILARIWPFCLTTCSFGQVQAKKGSFLTLFLGFPHGLAAKNREVMGKTSQIPNMPYTGTFGVWGDLLRNVPYTDTFRVGHFQKWSFVVILTWPDLWSDQVLAKTWTGSPIGTSSKLVFWSIFGQKSTHFWVDFLARNGGIVRSWPQGSGPGF